MLQRHKGKTNLIYGSVILLAGITALLNRQQSLQTFSGGLRSLMEFLLPLFPVIGAAVLALGWWQLRNRNRSQ